MSTQVSRHTLRQLKFIVPGGLATFVLGTHNALWQIFSGTADVGSWARSAPAHPRHRFAA